MPDFYDHDDEILAPDFINDSIRPLSHPEPLQAGQLFAAAWPGIIRESFDAFQNTLHITFGDLMQILGHGSFEAQPIFCHEP